MEKRKLLVISDMIKQLEELKEKHGDLPFVMGEEHHYWGMIDHPLCVSPFEFTESAHPEGPKSFKQITAIRIVFP